MEKESNKVRVSLTRPAHRKGGFIVPIIEDNGVFLTGQDLTYEQMTGKEKLTDEQRIKYPFVINPEVPHKIRHNVLMDRSKPEIETVLTLAIISGYIAENKAKYNSGVHEGYIIDPIADANHDNKVFDKVRVAMNIVGNTKSDDLDILVLLVSLQYNSPSAEGMITPSQQIQYLYKVAQTLPDNVINSNADNNPDIKNQLFVAYCIKHKLIKRKGNNYVIEENGKEVAYLGTTMEKTIAYLDNNSIFKDKLYTRLQEVEPYYKAIIQKNITISEKLIPLDTLKNSIYVAIVGIPGTTSEDNKSDLSKAKELLDEYFERSGNVATNDYKILYRQFLKRQYELEVEKIKHNFSKKTSSMIEACTINGYFAKYKEEVKAIETEEAKRTFMEQKYIDRETEKYNLKLQEYE